MKGKAMMWWILAGFYMVIAVLMFIGLARHMQPLDGQAWLSVFLAALFWPIFTAIIALG